MAMANNTTPAPVYPVEDTFRIPNLTIAEIDLSDECMKNREVSKTQ
jgi:hypothetical protein